MISKAKSIKGSVAAIDYIQNDKELGNAVELARNGIVEDKSKEIMKEFRLMQSANENCKNNIISIVISPSDERQFGNNELRKIGLEHLKRMGLDQHQFLMTKHGSTGHNHIHILLNRIDEKGIAYNDSFISKKIQGISEDIAKELGLTTAREVREINAERIRPIKQEILQAHQSSMKNSHTYQDYKDLMQSKGVIVKDSINKNGELQGFKFMHKSSELEFKASDIKKGVGAKDLVMNKVEMPKLTPTLQNIALNIAKQIRKEATRGMRLGF